MILDVIYSKSIIPQKKSKGGYISPSSIHSYKILKVNSKTECKHKK